MRAYQYSPFGSGPITYTQDAIEELLDAIREDLEHAAIGDTVLPVRVLELTDEQFAALPQDLEPSEDSTLSLFLSLFNSDTV